MPTSNYPAVPWGSRQDRIKRSLAEAEVLRRASRKAPEGQMVSGHFVAPHWSQQLGPLIDALRSSSMEYSAGEDQKALDAEMRADADNWMKSRPQVQTFGGSGEDREGNPIETLKVEPSQQQKLEWSQSGQTNPLTRALAAQYGSDILIKEPERQEAREFRKSEAEANRLWRTQEAEASREARALALADTLAQRAEAARLRSEDVRLGQVERAAAAKEARELQWRIAQMADATRRYAVDTRAGTAQDALDARIRESGKAGAGKSGGGGPGSAKTTEGEKSSAGYLQRMEAAEATLLGMGDRGQMNLAQKAVGGIPAVGKDVQPYTLGNDTEKLYQAQRDWVRAKLRKESGAVIGAEEMAEEIRTYFPQPGEGEGVKAQKAASRRRAIEQLRIGAGPLGQQSHSAGIPQGWSVTKGD